MPGHLVILRARMNMGSLAGMREDAAVPVRPETEQLDLGAGDGKLDFDLRRAPRGGVTALGRRLSAPKWPVI